MKFNTKQNQKGFTLIELLAVVTIIAILVGVTVSVINVPGQRNRAEDGIRLANISKIVEAIDAFHASEGYYPDDPDHASDFIDNWPVDPDGFIYDYHSTGDVYGVSIQTEALDGGYKFRSDWSDGKILQCSELQLPANVAGC